MVGFFNGIESAQPGGARNHIAAGIHKLLCHKIEAAYNHKREPVVETVFEVQESQNLDGSPHSTQPPGSMVIYYEKMNREMALGNLKGFLMAITGIEQVDENLTNYCVGPNQPLAGRIVWCRTTEKPLGQGRQQNPAFAGQPARMWPVHEWMPDQNQQPLSAPAPAAPAGFTTPTAPAQPAPATFTQPAPTPAPAPMPNSPFGAPAAQQPAPAPQTPAFQQPAAMPPMQPPAGQPAAAQPPVNPGAVQPQPLTPWRSV
jgi:hypothetical protein